MKEGQTLIAPDGSKWRVESVVNGTVFLVHGKTLQVSHEEVLENFKVDNSRIEKRLGQLASQISKFEFQIEKAKLAIEELRKEYVKLAEELEYEKPQAGTDQDKSPD